MGKVTVAWWKKVKAEAPSGLPSTGLESLLKKYEAALEKLGKARTAPNVEAAKKALTAVENGRVEAIKILANEKWATVRTSLNALATHIKTDRSELAETDTDLAVERKVDLSMNEDEGKYERLYAVFEKQEEGMKDRVGRLEFKTALATLGKLDQLADECMKTPALMKKYQKQKQVLAGKVQTVERLSAAYEMKIRDITALRKKAVEEVTGVETALARAKGQLGGIIQKIAAAKKANDAATVERQRAAAGMIVKGLLATDKEINDKYLASGTTVKDSTDVKAARMPVEDLTSIVKPFSDQLFILNRANKQAMKELQELAKTALS